MRPHEEIEAEYKLLAARRMSALCTSAPSLRSLIHLEDEVGVCDKRISELKFEMRGMLIDEAAQDDPKG